MGPVAIGFLAGALTPAPGDLSRLLARYDDGAHARFFPGVAAVAVRLIFRESAGAPGYFLPGLFISQIGGSLGYYRLK